MPVRAFVNADKPIIRISTHGGPPCAEIEFETIEDANAAVEQLNAILKKDQQEIETGFDGTSRCAVAS